MDNITIKSLAVQFHKAGFVFFEEKGPGFIALCISKFQEYITELNDSVAYVDTDDFVLSDMGDDLVECLIEAFDSRATYARVERVDICEIVKVLDTCAFVSFIYDAADHQLTAHVDMLIPMTHSELGDRNIEFRDQPCYLNTYKH